MKIYEPKNLKMEGDFYKSRESGNKPTLTLSIIPQSFRFFVKRLPTFIA